MRNIFASRLTELLKENNLSKRAFAEKIGVSAMSVSDWTNGNVQPNAESVYATAIFFDVSTDFLLGIENDFGVRVTANEPLAANEQELLSCYRQLSPYLQGVALNAVRGWANAAPNGATGNAQRKK